MSLNKKEWGRIKALPPNTAKRIWPKKDKKGEYIRTPYIKKKHGPIGRHN